MIDLEINRNKILEMYGRTELEVGNDVELIKEWMQFQPHLPPLDDNRIEFLLCASKFSLERTKKKIDSYLSIRNYAPEVFTCRDVLNDPDFLYAYQSVIYNVLPLYTDKCERVTIIALSKDSLPFNAAGLLKLCCAILDLRLKNDYCAGDVIIIDFSNVTFSHLKYLSFVFFKKAIDLILRGYGYNMTAVHIVNGSSTFDVLFSMAKRFIKPKILDRIHFHCNIDTLYEFVPRQILPNNYGGYLDDTRIYKDKLFNEVKENWQFFVGEQELMSNEKYRRNDCKNDIISMLDDVQGSFRKLQVD